jgi:hypothetical protein
VQRLLHRDPHKQDRDEKDAQISKSQEKFLNNQTNLFPFAHGTRAVGLVTNPNTPLSDGIKYLKDKSRDHLVDARYSSLFHNGPEKFIQQLEIAALQIDWAVAMLTYKIREGQETVDGFEDKHKELNKMKPDWATKLNNWAARQTWLWGKR